MRIFITGATGLLGRALVLRLKRDHHECVAWVRSPTRGQHMLGAQAEIIAEPLTSAVVGAAIHQCDAVVNLAGHPLNQLPWTATVRQSLRQSRLEVTRALVGHLQLGGPSSLINASGANAYGSDARTQLPNEQTPFGNDFLAQLVRDWEAEAQQAPKHVRVVMLRFGAILGLEGGILPTLLNMPVLTRFGPGDNQLAWLHVHDAAELILFALQHNTLAGPVNAAAPQPTSMQQLLRTMAKLKNKHISPVIPKALLQTLLGEAATMLLGNNSVDCHKLQTAGFHWGYPELEAALGHLLGQEGIYQRYAPSPSMQPQKPQHPYLQARPKPRLCLQVRQAYQAPMQAMFDFFNQPANLTLVTPMQIAPQLQSQHPQGLAVGDTMRFTVPIAGIPCQWESQVLIHDPPQGFVDAQTRGPYALWWHEHHLQTGRYPGETWLQERIFYRLPGGMVGEWLGGYLHDRQLDFMLRHRHHALALRFGQPLRLLAHA